MFYIHLAINHDNISHYVEHNINEYIKQDWMIIESKENKKSSLFRYQIFTSDFIFSDWGWLGGFTLLLLLLLLLIRLYIFVFC